MMDSDHVSLSILTDKELKEIQKLSINTVKLQHNYPRSKPFWAWWDSMDLLSVKAALMATMRMATTLQATSALMIKAPVQ